MSEPNREAWESNLRFIRELEAELQSLDRIRDVMSEYLSDECVPMRSLLAVLDGGTDDV